MRTKLYQIIVAGIASSIAFVASAQVPRSGTPSVAPNPPTVAGGVVVSDGDSNVVTGEFNPYYYYYARQTASPVKAAYLGLSCTPAQPALQKQLQLKSGVGLVIDKIDDDSPAAKAGVKELDVLHKIDDQLMINNEQLNVLVRSFDIGKDVKLTVIREGKPQTLTAKLVEREVKPLRFIYSSNPHAGVRFGNDPFGGGAVGGMAPGQPGANELMLTVPNSNRTVNASTVVIADERHKMTINSVNGAKRLKVQDKSGKTLFEGPVTTDAERDAMPADLRKAYNDLLKNADASRITSSGTTQPATLPALHPPVESKSD